MVPLVEQEFDITKTDFKSQKYFYFLVSPSASGAVLYRINKLKQSYNL